MCLLVLLFVVVISWSLASVFVAAEPQDPRDGDVLVLNDENFQRIASTKAILVVLFYAPWCSHCSRWIPKYAALAADMKQSGAFFSKLDATSAQKPNGWNDSFVFVPGVQTARRFNVDRFPTTRLFHYGRMNDQIQLIHEENELREAVALFTRPSSIALGSADSITSVVTSNPNGVVVIGFYQDKRDTNEFVRLGNYFRGIARFFHIDLGDRYALRELLELTRSISGFYGVNNTAVVVHPDDGAPSSWLAFGQGRSRASQETYTGNRTAWEDFGRNFVVLSDYVRDTEKPARGVLHPDCNIGGSQYVREKMVSFIASHVLNPVGVLTSKNRHLYQSRTNSTLFVFYASQRVFVPPMRNSKECDKPSSSSAECGVGIEEDAGSLKQLQQQQQQQIHVTTSEAELRYLGNRLTRVAQKPQFSNFSFLFVDAEANAQIFESFGFEKSDLHGETSRLKASHRYSLIGVIDGEKKYRYPYAEFATEFVEKFLSDIAARRISPFVKSSKVPTHVPKPGEGKVALLVYDNFEKLVKRDLSTDSVVLFANPHEEYSTLAVQSLRKLAEEKSGNTELLIGVYNALYNDPPKGFEVPFLPFLFFVPRSEKAKIKFSQSSPVTSIGRSKRVLQRNPDGTVTEEAFDSDHYEKLNGFNPAKYSGDFTAHSISSFVKDQLERFSRQSKK